MTTEEALQKAVQGATELLKRYGVIVQDYTSHVDVVTTPGHYVIYLELTTREGWGLPGADVLEKCCFVMEEAFNKGYKYFRVSGRIGPLEIRAVSDGTFKKLMDYAVSGGAAVTQYKVPRCVKLPHILELLNSQVISAHFSQACPHWSPQQSW
ncbi:indole-3-acetic acid-amido synthetase GH3.4-like [Asparagus officinalis]|nr:indole-3-acetic acid-amido synthetase GH3.4-like [Asparagus officinalis]